MSETRNTRPHLIVVLCILGSTLLLTRALEILTMKQLGIHVIVNVRKTTQREAVRIELELVSPREADVAWRVGDVIIGANERKFGSGTSRRVGDYRVMYTLDTQRSDRMVYFIVREGDLATTYEIDISGKHQEYKQPISCDAWFSFPLENQTTTEADYICTPDLNAQDPWYMNTGMFIGFQNNDAKFTSLDSETNSYINVTYERGAVAQSTISISRETRQLFNDFLFLFSAITIPRDSLISQITYRTVWDLSENKIPGEFRFMESAPLPDFLEGDPLSIVCEAIGRNPPPLEVQKDAQPIPASESVSFIRTLSPSLSSKIATIHSVTEQTEGNYSCVATDMDGVQQTSQVVEVKLKPRFRPDLSAVMENGAKRKHILVVVEGAKGVAVVCSGSSWPTEGVEVSTERTSISQWNERLEVNFSWWTQMEQEAVFQQTPIVSCTAADKHGETTVDRVL